MRARRLYGLHAGDGVIVYVGSTTLSLKARRHCHLKSRHQTTTPLAGWLRATPISCVKIVLLAEPCTIAGEMAEIARRVAAGERLLNVIGGAEHQSRRFGTERHSVEARDPLAPVFAPEWAAHVAVSQRATESSARLISEARRPIRPREPLHINAWRDQRERAAQAADHRKDAA